MGKFNITLPFGADTALISLSFFEMGVVLRNYEKSISKKYIIFYIVAVVSSVIYFILCGRRVEMYSSDYGNILLFEIASFSGIIGTIALAQNIRKCAPIEKMGKAAMYLYGAQLVPLSIYRELNIEGNALKVFVGFLTTFFIGMFLIRIKPIYDVLYVKLSDLIESKVDK